jgi:glucosamine 6-phosphate synthetase-like amidotransferase/phosphosugar isomerase protein
MCGIVGAFALDSGNVNSEQEVLRRESMVNLFTEILQVTHKRGEDATGVSAAFDNSDFMILKNGVSSLEFISKYGGTNKDFEGFLKLCRNNPAPLNILLGHCRKSSVGNTYDNENNHPIRAGEIVGIHNGTLKNHDIIFEKTGFPRDGEVDSEAIFRLLQGFTNNGSEPFTTDILAETMMRLEGAASVLAYNINNPFQVAAFRDARPMEIFIIKPLKLMLIASEKEFVKTAFYQYNKIARLYRTNLPLISADDIEHLELKNNYAAVIDLTRPVTKDTKVEDLMDSVDTWKNKGIWRTPTKAYSSGYGDYYGASYGTSNVKKDVGFVKDQSRLPYHGANTAGNLGSAKKDDKSASDSDKKDTKVDGKVFCKELNKYVSPDDVKNSEKTGPSVMSTIDKNPSELSESVPAKKEKPVSSVKKEVDVSLEPKVLEAANDCTEGLTRYENNTELSEDLGAKDEDSVGNLQAFSLANRVRKKVFSEAFIAGAKYYKRTSVEELSSKSSAAEKAVITAKNIAAIVCDAIANLDKQPSNLEKVLKEAIASNDFHKLDANVFGSVFTEGNMKKHAALGILNDLLRTDNGKKDISG